jgi:hypothetical protein
MAGSTALGRFVSVACPVRLEVMAEASRCQARSRRTPSTIFQGADWGADIGVAVGADSVYWMDEDRQRRRRIMKAPLRGGTPITLVETVGEIWDLAVDDTSVYYTDAEAGTVVKVTPK